MVQRRPKRSEKKVPMMTPKNAPPWKVDTMLDDRLALAAALRPKAVLNDGKARVPPMKAES
jgi:hypothetical protein